MTLNTIDTISYLSDVIYVLQKHPFAKASDSMPTCDMAQDLAAARPDDWHERQEARVQQARAVVDWAESLSGSTTYEHNLKALLTQDTLPTTRFALALAASSVPSWERAQRKAQEHAYETSSSHVGAPGEKLLTTLTLKRTFPCATKFGQSWRMHFHDNQGNVITWFTGSPPKELLESEAVGREFTAKFTIKNHTEFRDVAQTEIARLAFHDWGNVIEAVANPVPKAKAPRTSASRALIPYLVLALNRRMGHSEATKAIGAHAELAKQTGVVTAALTNRTWDNPKVLHTDSLYDSAGEQIGFWQYGMSKPNELHQVQCYAHSVVVTAEPGVANAGTEFLRHATQALVGAEAALNELVELERPDAIRIDEKGEVIRVVISGSYDYPLAAKLESGVGARYG